MNKTSDRMHREGEVLRISQGKVCCPETIFLKRFDKIIKILKKPKKLLNSDIQGEPEFSVEL